MFAYQVFSSVGVARKIAANSRICESFAVFFVFILTISIFCCTLDVVFFVLYIATIAAKIPKVRLHHGQNNALCSAQPNTY